METLRKVLARSNGLQVYQRRIDSGAYTLSRGKKPRQCVRHIRWPGMPVVRVLVKRGAV